ncbi:hypothetical protein GB931_18510 [Modestobacter sp. I12A-02628]|uniref:histidine kinase n=1 Tax=Goekera deserti TaxID=2497753 RepID=A0A7K3WAE5_9ACTN|nr:histidine kinase [Goekera deserti]MPQ99871.1 hypothetical protein [Goekera deserti]NDI50030.1 hypothetical protein [Goekera deserti]NEL52493.1 hypothetical protein [Goekera deserti]
MSTREPRRWPRWLDPALAGSVGVVGVAELAGRDAPVGHYVTATVMAAALAWRRTAPVAVFAVVIGTLFVQQALRFESDSFSVPLTLFPAAYTLGAHAPLWRSAVSFGVGMLVLAVGTLLEGLPLSEAVFPAIVCTALWGAGAGLRGRIEAAVAADLRARTAEELRDTAAAAAVADERARIARELHDVVAHAVTVMVMQSGALRRMLPAEATREVGLAGTVERTGRDALVELRRMLGLLREVDGEPAPLAPHPGLARLDELVERTAAAGIPVRLTIEQPCRELPPAVDLCVYRVVQESLTNVIKHAGVAHARVEVRFPPGAVELAVVDDGHGDRAASPGGNGLLGMGERVAVFGGQLQAGPCFEGGFAVRARLPVEPR